MKQMAFLFLFLSGLFFANSTAHSYVFFSPTMTATHIEGYNEEEKKLIFKDLNIVREIVFDQEKEGEGERPVYLATAGAPGCRKTTILERFLQGDSRFSQAIYVDPDQRSLKFMAHTYYNLSLNAYEVGKEKEYAKVQKKAYEKWRGASNFITLTLLEEAFDKRKTIAHGTTSTGGHIEGFLNSVKENGYDIVLLLCSCEDHLRVNAISYRNEKQAFYQSTPEDAISKAKFFPMRMPAYFNYGDEIHLFWSDDLFSKERKAAIFKRGEIEIVDEDAYQRFIEKYERDRALLKEEKIVSFPWDEIVQMYLNRF